LSLQHRADEARQTNAQPLEALVAPDIAQAGDEQRGPMRLKLTRFPPSPRDFELIERRSPGISLQGALHRLHWPRHLVPVVIRPQNIQDSGTTAE